jgi:hypothetical protein
MDWRTETSGSGGHLSSTDLDRLLWIHQGQLSNDLHPYRPWFGLCTSRDEELWWDGCGFAYTDLGRVTWSQILLAVDVGPAWAYVHSSGPS